MRTREIVVSYPGDVREAADQVVAVAGDLARAFARHGVQVTVWRWDTDNLPAPDLDAQKTINRRMAPTYDIYIGLMCSRLGTPTPRAASGTLEEFEQAIRRRKTTGRPDILFYFCEHAARSSDVEAFRRTYPLFLTYSSISDLADKVRDHLLQLLLKRAIPTPARDFDFAHVGDALESAASQLAEVPPVAGLRFDAGWATRAFIKVEAMFALRLHLIDTERLALHLALHGIAAKHAGTALDLDVGANAASSLANAALEMIEADELFVATAAEVPAGRPGIVAALAQLGTVLNLDRRALANPTRSLPNDASPQAWAAWCTRAIETRTSGTATYFLDYPSPEWIDALKRITVFEAEAAWQRHRSALSRCGLSFTLTPCELTLEHLPGASAMLPTAVTEAADRVGRKFPIFAHLGEGDALGNLLPHPCTKVADSIPLSAEDVASHVYETSSVDGAWEVALPRSGELIVPHWSSQKVCRWRELRDDGFAHLSITRAGEVRRLSDRERAAYDSVKQASESVKLSLWARLGLWNEVIATAWPRLLGGQLGAEGKFALLTAFGVGLDWLEENCLSSLFIDTYRDAHYTVRSRLLGD